MELLKINEFSKKSDSHMEKLELFCNRCKQIGIINNSSVDKLKIDTFANRNLKYWIVEDKKKGEIVGIAGAHEIDELGRGFYRLLFRGCMLPRYRGMGLPGLSKRHMNSFLFKNITPLQISWAKSQGAKDFVITTNIHFNAGMSKTDLLFRKLEKQRVVSLCFKDIDLFHTRQNVWKLNLDLFT